MSLMQAMIDAVIDCKINNEDKHELLYKFCDMEPPPPMQVELATLFKNPANNVYNDIVNFGKAQEGTDFDGDRPLGRVGMNKGFNNWSVGTKV